MSKNGSVLSRSLFVSLPPTIAKPVRCATLGGGERKEAPALPTHLPWGEASHPTRPPAGASGREDTVRETGPAS